MSGKVSPERLHPSHLRRLAPSVSPPVLVALAGHARFAGRFGALLPPALRNHDLPEPASAAERLAFDTAQRIGEAGLMMGAARHARSIGRCIGSDAVSVLEIGIGQEARAFGLRSASQAVIPAETLTTQALVERVRTDGLRCLVRWRDSLAEPFRALATLKLPHATLPDSALADADPIITNVLERVADAA